MSDFANTKKNYFLPCFLNLKHDANIFSGSNYIIYIKFIAYIKKQLNKSKDLCGICLSSPFDPYRPINCEHYFCYKCIIKWYKNKKNSCPICRRPFTMIAPKNIDAMKKDIMNTNYYSQKKFHNINYIKNNTTNSTRCDICEKYDFKDNLLNCVCCQLFFTHYYCDLNIYICDTGYIY